MPERRDLPPSPPGIPVFGNAVQFVRDPFGFVRESARTTGDVFRMRFPGADVYVLAHPDHVETALLDRESFGKLDDFSIAFGDALLAVEGDRWRRQRHAMESFFDPTRIREHADTMVSLAGRRAERWTDGSTVRIDTEMRSLALRNLFEVVLGYAPTADELDELAETAHALNLWFEPTSWVLPAWVPTPARRSFRRGVARMRDHARSLLAEGGDEPEEGSLLAKLATLRDDPDSGVDEAEVLDQVVGMVFAGHETTALSLTFALQLLGANPAVAERVFDELDETLDGPPSAADLEELPVLDRVIHETMRLYPPVHAIPRVTEAPVTLDAHTIPADETVLLSTWCLHRDPREYDDPETFAPRRWASTTPRDRGYSFVPFGGGPRICIGRHLAELELKATLAEVCRRYRIEATGSLDVSPQMTTQPDGPVTIRVTDRRR
ncbi:cytochrome P450 [Halobaculum rubrum]|uniref:cytochrome P450 n=1 Tax=Halobaculum rubrum TaxID=2872158 RepID=UPI001CA3BC75|nr:cytochrome P450 [Halobaculum rubrum]QZX98993.1 cytochrome P450 [Halobaculum rubrum]